MQGRTNGKMGNPIRQRMVKLSLLELQSLFQNVNADAKISLQMKIVRKQHLYLRNSIDVKPCYKKNSESRRSRTCVYKLRGIKVCNSTTYIKVSMDRNKRLNQIIGLQSLRTSLLAHVEILIRYDDMFQSYSHFRHVSSTKF